MREHYSNLLLISGTGQNVGKTTFICNVIDYFRTQHNVIALKISPHYHNDKISNQKIIKQTDKFRFIEENNPDKNKDSSRMLRAGAYNVYYLEYLRGHFQGTAEFIKYVLNHNNPVICESGGLHEIFDPQIHFVIKNIDNKLNKKQIAASESINITFDGSNYDFELDKLAIVNNSWKLVL